MRWYTAMHDRANILISPSSLGRLVVRAYLHWRVANATNLNRVGNIGLHRGWFAVSFLCNWNQTKVFCWYCFFHYLYYPSIVVSLLFILSFTILYRRLHIIHFRLPLGVIYLRCLSFFTRYMLLVYCDLFFSVIYLFLIIIYHCSILQFIIYFYVSLFNFIFFIIVIYVVYFVYDYPLFSILLHFVSSLFIYFFFYNYSLIIHRIYLSISIVICCCSLHYSFHHLSLFIYSSSLLYIINNILLYAYILQLFITIWYFFSFYVLFIVLQYLSFFSLLYHYLFFLIIFCCLFLLLFDIFQ